MTRITSSVYKDAYVIRAEGHATGSVEACAAISALLQALAQWTFRKGYREDQVLEPGHACVVLPRDLGGSRAVWELITDALETICEDEENFSEMYRDVGQETKKYLI